MPISQATIDALDAVGLEPADLEPHLLAVVEHRVNGGAAADPNADRGSPRRRHTGPPPPEVAETVQKIVDSIDPTA
jgi:hypothetical protein